MTEAQITPIHEHDEEISLLDILVTLTESWRLLVLGPLCVGVLAGCLSFLWPKTFESVAILRLTEDEVALMHAAPVLDPLIAQFGLLVEADGFLDDARQDLKKQLIFTFDKKTKLATITFKARDPSRAQALGDAAIAGVLKELQVKGKDKLLIEKTIAINNDAIKVSEEAAESIQRSLKRGLVSDQAQESAVKNLAGINSDVAKRKQENEELIQKLDPRGVEVLVQAPSLPQRKTSPKLGWVMLLAVLASGFILFVFVFIRKAWQTAKQDQATSAKISIISKNLTWWASK